MDQLKRSVDRLSKEAMEIRAEMHARTIMVWRAICIGAIIVILTFFAAWKVTLDNRHAIEINNYKLCPMLEVSTVKPGDSPPTTARGREVAARATQLYTDFDCARLKRELSTHND